MLADEHGRMHAWQPCPQTKDGAQSWRLRPVLHPWQLHGSLFGPFEMLE